MTACVVSTQLGSTASPRGQVCTLFVFVVFIAATHNFTETKQSHSHSRDDRKDVYLVLNAATSGATDGAEL